MVSSSLSSDHPSMGYHSDHPSMGYPTNHPRSGRLVLFTGRFQVVYKVGFRQQGQFITNCHIMYKVGSNNMIYALSPKMFLII